MGCREDPSPGSAPTSSSGTWRDRAVPWLWVHSPLGVLATPKHTAKLPRTRGEVFGPMTLSWCCTTRPATQPAGAPWRWASHDHGARTVTAAEAGEQTHQPSVLTPLSHAASRTEWGSLSLCPCPHLVNLCPRAAPQEPTPGCLRPSAPHSWGQDRGCLRGRAARPRLVRGCEQFPPAELVY